MTAKILLICLAALLVLLPAADNVTAFRHHQRRHRRQVVQPAAKKGSFYRGAVESPPAPFGRLSIDYAPAKLKVFSQPIFLSQFAIPSLNVDYVRQAYPNYYQPAPHCKFLNNYKIQKAVFI